MPLLNYLSHAVLAASILAKEQRIAEIMGEIKQLLTSGRL